uniref:Uncharacterized protein LOC104245182 n=1 Tax=Nicotiana sylvestris TaxID=4096 RepID=A0A1U7YJQ7_NICSY|nr:PREDICTED: uncharacterized protein LOC104245182 [Nicotiana sylvestris]
MSLGVPGVRERGRQGIGGGTGGKGGKSIELAKILLKRKVNIACVQETRWVGSRARDADEYKLWYSGVLKGKNGVEFTLNVVITYAPQSGLDEDVKRHFGEGLDVIEHNISPAERLFMEGDFNGHIGSIAGGYGEVHGGFDFGDMNARGTSLLDFAKAFELVIANSSFSKRKEH